MANGINKVPKSIAVETIQLYTEIGVYKSAISTLESMVERNDISVKEGVNVEKSIETMYNNMRSMEAKYATCMQKVMSEFGRTTCILRLTDVWFGVLVTNFIERKVVFIMSSLKSPVCEHLSSINIASEGLPTIEELNALIGENTSEKNLLREYVATQERTAYETVILPLLKIEVDGRSMCVSKHAQDRWKERKKESVLTMVEDNVVHKILDSFEGSTKVWEMNEDTVCVFDYVPGAKTIEFYYNSDDNTMFVVSNHNIITLYEEDYGFATEINIATTLMNLDRLEKIFNINKEQYEKLGCDSEEVEDLIKILQEERDEVASRLNAIDKVISSKKGVLKNINSNRGKLVTEVKNQMDILFKKYTRKQ